MTHTCKCFYGRKGIKSVVLEKDDSLQLAGTGIAIYTNGWRALDQLNVGNKLRSMSIPLHLYGCTLPSFPFLQKTNLHLQANHIPPSQCLYSTTHGAYLDVFLVTWVGSIGHVKNQPIRLS